MTFSKKLFGSLLIFSLAIVSCKNDKEPAPADTAPSENVTTTAPVTPAPTATPAPSAVTATSQATAAGMNPPHGQPGHRCEIPVGAPLDSQPSANATPQQQPPVNFMQQNARPAQNQTATTAPGMNPPHGQPGHRCEIAVGAPLPAN